MDIGLIRGLMGQVLVVIRIQEFMNEVLPRGKVSSSRIRQQSENMQDSGPQIE